VPLETATYISDLVASNPAHTDGLNNADAHARLTKQALLNTFPGLIGPLTRAGNGVVAGDGSPPGPGYAFINEPTLGIFRATAGIMKVGGGRLEGVIPAGMIMDYAGPNCPPGWLTCDGQGLPAANYSELFAAIGYTWGGSNGTFWLPNAGNRYRRHQGSLAGVVGTLQNCQNLNHAHSVSLNTGAESAGHTHTFAGTSTAMSANAVHSHGYAAGAGAFQYASSASDNKMNVLQQPGQALGAGTWGGPAIAAANIDHTHDFSGATSGENVSHYHLVQGNTGADGGNETRPYSMTTLTIIKY
jgi:microcystin-dependent protein